MAYASKTISAVGSHGYHTFKMKVTEKSVNTSANTSTVNVLFTIKPKVSGYDWEGYTSNPPSGTVYFNNQSWSWTLPNYNGTSTVTLVDKTVTVAHNADGSKTITGTSSNNLFRFSCSSLSDYYLPGNASAYGSITLTKITRAATVTVSSTSKTETSITNKWTSDLTASKVEYRYSSNSGSTWSDWTSKTVSAKTGSYTISGLSANTSYQIQTRVTPKDITTTTTASNTVKTYNWPYATVGNFNVKDGYWIKVTNPLGREGTVDVYAEGRIVLTVIGELSDTYIDPADVANSMLSEIPNSMTGSWYCTVTYGEHVSTSATATYSATGYNPTITSATYADANTTAQAIIQNNQTILQNIGTPRFTASGTAQYTATIASGKVTILGNETTLTRSGNNVVGTTGVINSATNVTATVTIIDSRGNSASQNVTVTMAAYTLPSAIITLNRKNNYYSLTDITVDADVMPLGTNTPTITAKWKETGTSTWSSPQTIPDNTLTALNGSTGLDNTKAWDIQVTIVDSFGGTTIYSTGVGIGLPILYIDRMLRAVGINSFPEADKPFVVNGVDILGWIKPKLIEPTALSVSGVTFGDFYVYQSAGICMMTLEVTLSGAKSSWTQIATGLPIPATASLETPVSWIDTATGWDSSFHRPMRVLINVSGGLYVRYGAAGTYRLSLSYPINA